MADANSNSSFTHDQISKFRHLLERVRNDAGIFVPTVSTDNSSALLTTSLTHFDPNILLLSQHGFPTRGYVRVGGAIYGQRPAFPQLQPVSTLLAAVRHVSIIKDGESVGYDRAYVAPHSVRIATLAIGFADGYPRDLGNGRGKVAIRSKLYPIAGNVCMDMLMVDLGPAEEETDVRVGDMAVLWGGDHGMPLKEVASILGTTQSDLTCGLKSRVLRNYIT
jgi:alanine racemase